MNGSIASLNEELDSLKQYKNAKETEEKVNIIKEYTELLSEEILGAYAAKLNEYTASDLDKELAYEVKKNNSSIFNKKDNSNGYVPKDIQPEGISAILSKYKK